MGPLVLVMPNRAYRADDFLAAAARAGAEVIVASDRCHMLDGVYRFPEGSLVLDYHQPERAAEDLVAQTRARRPAAIVATEGETPALVAALAARALGLRAVGVAAARAARDKYRMRIACAAAGVPVPSFAMVPLEDPVPPLGFPCVLKPRFLAASRGVIRADDPRGYAAAHARLSALLAIPEVRALDPDAAGSLLVEEFVPGPEVALEGMVDRGRVVPLAFFDKPDSLDGPFFEETYFVTPSRHPEATQAAAWRVAESAAAALGIEDGPIHAELRLGRRGPVLLELAARSIGGLCGRMLRFGAGMTLEDVIVRHALGLELAPPARDRRAAGAVMLPIPAAGVLRAVDGVDQARALPLIEDVVITAPLEGELVPLPEGSSYLGFVFARGAAPDEVEAALRAAQAKLRFTIVPTLPTV
jgi:biotin carboxylase